MKRTWKIKHVSAFLFGIVLLSVETWMNVQEIMTHVGVWYDSLILAAIAVCLGSAYALYSAEDSYINGNYITAFFLFSAFAVGAAFQGTTTLDRVATQRDAKLMSVWRSDKEWDRLTKVEENMSYAAARECSKVIGVRSRGDACKSLEEERQIAKRLRQEREIELDSLGQRIAAMLPFVSPKTASMYVPVLLPIALFVLANMLIVYGGNGERIEEEFDTSAAGRAAIEDKILRFIKAYTDQNGKPPEAKVIVDKLKVGDHLARRILKKAA